MMSGRFLPASSRTARDRLRRRRPPVDDPDPLREEALGVVVRLRLHILRQGKRDGARLGGIGQHPHRVHRRGDQLLRPHDPVPVPADRLEAVGGGHGVVAIDLDLLQHRVRLPGREVVARQEQHRNPVDRRRRRARDHVQRPGADRRCAGVDLATPALLREGRRRMHHALLVLALDIDQPAGIPFQRLAQSGHVPVPENADHALHEGLLHAVHRDVLLFKELEQRLGHCQANGAQNRSPPAKWIKRLLHLSKIKTQIRRLSAYPQLNPNTDCRLPQPFLPRSRRGSHAPGARRLSPARS